MDSKSTTNDILDMNPQTDIPINANTSNPVDKPTVRHVTLRNLVNLIIILRRGLARANAKVQSNDINYWKNLATVRGEENERYIRIIDLQRQRIETLENDLKTLVNLAKETQQMLSGIAAEKQDNEEL